MGGGEAASYQEDGGVDLFVYVIETAAHVRQRSRQHVNDSKVKYKKAQ